MTYVVFGEFHDHISTTTLDRKYAEYVKAAKVKKFVYMISAIHMLAI